MRDRTGLIMRREVAVLITDISGARSQQMDLIRAVRRNHPQVVVLVYSEERDSTVIGKLINEGQIFRFMSKPAGPACMGRTIQAALAKHRQLMAQPSSIARHALDISRLAAFARSRHDPVDGVHSVAKVWMARAEPAPPAVPGLAAQLLADTDCQAFGLVERGFSTNPLMRCRSSVSTMPN